MGQACPLLAFSIVSTQRLHRDRHDRLQCWTEGRRSTAVAEDLGPTATATVAEVSRLMWIMIALSLTIKAGLDIWNDC